jgi:predicted transcriptional regulator
MIILEYWELEAQLEAKQRELEQLSNSEEFKRELEFEGKLKALMIEYDVSAATVIDLLGGGQKPAVQAVKKITIQRDNRPEAEPMTFKNPYTQEEVTVRRINHLTIRAWIREHGEAVVRTWQQ